jgi:hypothetical protein
MLKVQEEEKSLKELDKRVNKLVTAEQRREIELKELAEYFEDDEE